MKARYLSILLGASLMGLVSCNEFLDINPTDKATDKLVWSDSSYATMAVNYFYADIARLGNFSSYQCLAGMTEGLTDELKYGNMTYNAQMYIPNEIAYGGTVLTAGYTDVYMGVWGTTYDDIRRVNEALAKLQGSRFSETTKTRLGAELRFFRGMYYFELMKRYHQVILYDENLSRISTNHELATEAQGWDFIRADLEYAGEHLPVSTQASDRLTSGAAYALLSRAMLYCQNWEAVKTAAQKVMGMGYALTTNYADAFKADNNEAIFQYTYSLTNDISHSFDGYYAPGGDKAADGNQMAGGYATPTQEMVEEYELATGGRPDWSPWHSPSGTTEQPPYDQLEPRFQATVLYNGASWKGRTIEPFVGGADGWCKWETDAQNNGRTTTGYYLRKLVDETHHFTDNQNSSQPFIAFRLAEVYLNYAEACYRSGDNAKALEYINKVRARVKLPLLTGLSGDGLFAALRHERKVELAYEALYYWDMRRWGLSPTAFTGIRRHGLKIEKNANGSFTYTYVEVDNQDLNYPAKMNRLPLPLSELENNALVEQFAEWK